MKTGDKTRKELIDHFREFGKMFEKSDAGSGSFDERMQDLGVQEKESVIKWRDKFSKFMTRFLMAQYFFILLFLFLQGFKIAGFHLDNYIFYILIGGTLVQSYFLVRIIFQYLFSSKK